MSKPLVSVIFPSYNHAGFIGVAMDSVLAQDYEEMEIIVSDDASKDDTLAVLNKYTDPRIRTHAFAENQGAALNGRWLLRESRGKYVALINSDDVWLPGHLSKSVAYLEAHPECSVCFSFADLIDENGKLLVADCEVFHQENRTRAQWLNRLFTGANCLCHPSMVIRREVYDHVGAYVLGMRQLPDFWMWVNVCKHYEMHVQQEVQVQHRRCVGTMQNTSAPVVENSIRDVSESLYILMHFFDGLSDADFRAAFSDLFRDKEAVSHEALLCEKFFLMLDQKFYMKKVSYLAAHQMYLDICNLPGVIELLMEHYHYTINDFYSVGTELDLLGLRAQQQPTQAELAAQAKMIPFVPGWKRALDKVHLLKPMQKVYHRMKGDMQA